MFLEELGLTESGLDRLIKCSYALLGLISFLTCGPDECRAWTIRKGTRAPQAAGKIHSDFERGFIRAEVVSYEDLMACGTMAAAREKGLIRSEGKEYVVQDGDIILFDRLAKHFHTPRRGDAYAFVNEAGGVSIGRVGGLPGEQVQMEAGVVYIDGVALEEGAYTQGSGQSFAPVTLGQGEFLLLPDDRVHALLEEESLVVTFSDLVGRAAIRIAPWRRLAVFVP